MARLIKKPKVFKTVPIVTYKKQEDGSVKETIGAENQYYKKANGRIGMMTISKEASLTVQGDHDLAEIHSIISRHTANEIFNNFVHDVDNDGVIDVADIPNYFEGLTNVRKAEEQFARLPSRIRKEFGNNCHKFVDFCTDPKNMDRMVELGLAVPREEPPAPPQTAQTVSGETKQTKTTPDSKQDKKEA